MSSGYVLYSLDTGRFQQFVTQPTPAQLCALSSRLAQESKLLEGEFAEGNPKLEWTKGSAELTRMVAQRLTMPDWYGDLSRTAKVLWERTMLLVCIGRTEIDVGFRVEHDGVYWDVIDVAKEQMGAPPKGICDAALAAFGTRPYRYFPPGNTRGGARSSNQLFGILHLWLGLPSSGRADLEAWTPMHSMHETEQVRAMLAELKSVEAQILASKGVNVRSDFAEALVPALKTIVRDGRMLVVQVDT